MGRWRVLARAGLLYPTPSPAQRVRLTIPLPEPATRAVQDSTDPTRHYELVIGYLLHHRPDDPERALRLAPGRFGTQISQVRAALDSLPAMP